MPREKGTAMATNRSPLESNTATGPITRRAALGRLAGGSAIGLLATMGQDRVQAQATPTPQGDQGEAPNHFVLAGALTQISYEVTTDAGGRLTYQGTYGSQTLVGDAIRVEESALGRLVTGYLGAFPDQGELWLTLLLPRFNPMTIGDAPSPFDTVAILKWAISTIGGPPRTGALEEYRVVELEGTAEVGPPLSADQ
jgi:hypothetical protein